MISCAENNKPDEQYGEKEASQRLEAALRGAFLTPPKPMKDIPRKRPKTIRKPKTKASV
jgi:hypothetical protein